MFSLFCDIYETLLTVKATNMKQENIYTVKFTNGSSVFIQAMDEAHARRIVERNGSTWTRGDDSVEMVIEKIEESAWLLLK